MAVELVSGPATLVGNVLTPTAPGVVVVRATQPGGSDFDPAPAIERSFTVRRSATISLGNLSQTYAAAPRPISFVIDPTEVAASVTYGGSATPPRNVGSYPVRLAIVDPLVTGTSSGVLQITKASLGVAPRSQRRLVGTDNKPIELVYSGFQGTDTKDGLLKRPVAKTTAVKVSKPGDYPITLSGGADANYAFVFSPGFIRVVGFGGAYEALLISEADGTPAGKVELQVSATAPTFTGTLNWEGEGGPLTLRGSIQLDPGLSDADPAVAIGTSAAASHGYSVQLLRLAADEVRLDVYRGTTRIASGVGPRIFAPTANASLTWAGPRSAWFSDFFSSAEGDVRPIPAGSGYATFTVPPSGAFTLVAKLPDGSSLSAFVRPDANGGYRLFGRPHGARAHSYLAGELRLKDLGPTTVVWRKSIATGTVIDANFRAGFAMDGTATPASWTPPRAATTALPAITWADTLGLELGTGVFSFEIGGAELPGASGLPGDLAIDTAGKVTLSPTTTANPRKFAFTATGKNGAVAGSFILLDGRKVSFSAAMRRASGSAPEGRMIGRGFFIVPPATKGAESITGEIRLVAPEDIP